MKTLVTTALVGALGLTEWIVDTVPALALLAALTAVATIAWAATIYRTAKQADAQAALRRRDAEFAARHRVAR